MISSGKKPTKSRMSEPGPSEVRTPQDPDRIDTFYVEMSDAIMLKHVRSLLEEISKRPHLDVPIPTTYPVVPECVPMETIDPKTELEDSAYLEMHHESRGIEYNYEDDSYNWNPRFGGDQREVIRKVNELNEYGRRRRLQMQDSEEESEGLAESRSPSPPRPVKRGSRSLPILRQLVTAEAKKGDLPVVCKCSICSEDFPTISSLLDHRRDAHSEKDMLTCGFCRKVLSSRTHMNFHLTQEYKVHHCQNCENSFASHWHLTKHTCQANRKRVSDVILNAQGLEDEDDEMGDNEGDTTATSTGASGAVRAQGGADDGYSCGKCGKIYMHKGWLEKHQMKCVKKEIEMEADGVTILKCDICHRVYSSPYWYETHKKKCTTSTPQTPVVLPGKPTARCHLCAKMFQNERSLEYHMRHCRAKQQRLRRQREEMDMDEDMEAPPIMRIKREVESEEEEEEVDEMAEPGEQGYSTRSSRRGRGTIRGIRNQSVMSRMKEEEVEEDEDSEEEEEEEEDEEEDKKHFQPPCSICGLLCTGVINLLTHRRLVHGNDAMLTCGLCGSKFNCQSSITRHMNMEYSLYLCKKCGRNCHDSTVLRQHVCSSTSRPWNYHVGRRSAIIPKNVHIVPPSPSMPAGPSSSARKPVPPQTSKSEPAPAPKIVTMTTALQKALLMTTPSIPSSSRHQSVKCPDCQESFPTSFVLYNHRMTCEPKRRDDRQQPGTSGGPSTSSSTASTSTSAGRTRTDTIRTIDSADDFQAIKCPECHKEFMYLREIAHHRHTVHGKQEFECVYCPKAFSLLRTLGDHHALELKRWACQDCHKTFTRRYLLTEHQKDGCDSKD